MTQPKVEVLPIEQGATPDPQNIKGGVGALFFGVSFLMAIHAQRQTIRNFVSKFWILCPFFYMMGVNINAPTTTILTGVIVSQVNSGTPLLVWVTSRCFLAFAFITFVGWVFFSLLKMSRALPFFRSGTFFYPCQKFISKIRFGMMGGIAFPNFVFPDFGSIRAFFRAIIMVLRWGCSKLFSTVQALFYNRWMGTLPRAILTSSIFSFKLAWQFEKSFPAPLTRHFNSSDSFFSVSSISAFMGTVFPHSVGNSIFGKLKFLTAKLTNSYNHFLGHFLSKKVLPAGLRSCCSGNIHFSHWGAYEKKNPLYGYGCLNTVIIPC